MKGMNIGVCAVAAGLLMAASSASAAPVVRDYTINATGNCNAALPAYEGAIRKRPLAVQNEGTTDAFVSCSLPGDFTGTGNYLFVVGLSNLGTTSITVNCTYVDGLTPPIGEPAYLPQSVTIAAGSIGFAVWESEEGELFTQFANVSCLLPPNAAINVLEVQFEQDNGVEEPA